VASGHVFHGGDAFGRSLVGQHGAGDQIANGIDAGHLGLVAFIHRDTAAARIGPNAQIFQPQPLGQGATADGDQQAVERQDLFTVLSGNRDPDLFSGHPGFPDLGAEPEFKSLAAQYPVQGARHLPVRQMRRSILETAVAR